ncbi:alanyl-tRNA editing protein [Salmonella enterica]|nr:alanyl-tRNA editing protein [Salmonella enterica]ECH1723476.1 alanyl-tRNA editing protein [Salmonella enterica]
MTKRLFDDKPYDSFFHAKVIFIGIDYIVLDQTLFYPLSGNQQFDKGTLNGVDVISVEIDTKDNDFLDFHSPIKHFIDISSFKIGQQVKGIIDINRRRKIMRLHTASHIVEYFIKQMPVFISVEGSFVNDEKDRTDYRLSQNLDPESLKKLEADVNEFINTGQAIFFKQDENIRFWCCGDIKMPCCGTHVHNVSEVGEIIISRKNKGKGINRIEIHLKNE